MERRSHNHGLDDCREHPTGDCIIQAYVDRIERLSYTVRKLSGHAAWDISELIDEGYLKEGDLD